MGFVYSTDISAVASYLSADSCLHLLCTKGSGTFQFNGRTFRFSKNDAVVVSRPDLFDRFTAAAGTQVECLIAPLQFLYNQLPANNYGIGGCISLWDNPIISMSEKDAAILQADFRRLRDRMGDVSHKFYREVIGSLALTMIYDLFHFHARQHQSDRATDRKSDLVSRLVALLSGGRTRQHREVAYYAGLLDVSPKYLGNVVKRQTGRSVSHLIDQYTVPMLIEYLKDSKMSLAQISGEFNFSSLSYFSRYVQKQLGMSPSEYRASLQPSERENA